MKYALRFHFYSTFENYLWHINTLILCNGIEWNMVIVGIYFTRLEAVFHLIYTLLWRNKINQIRGEISFSFDTWKLLVADGGGRPAASAGGAARPAAGGRRPGQRGVPTLAAAADRERWTSAAARLVRCVNSRTVLWLYWAVSHHRMCRYGSRVISLRTIWLFMWSSSCTCFEYTLVAYKHTYFVQRNRMKCGHSRNLFYVSRSYFSFYLHTFLTHLNKWNTRWDFIFIRHLKTTFGI